jgi:hypothetical protein
MGEGLLPTPRLALSKGSEVEGEGKSQEEKRIIGLYRRCNQSVRLRLCLAATFTRKVAIVLVALVLAVESVWLLGKRTKINKT